MAVLETDDRIRESGTETQSDPRSRRATYALLALVVLILAACCCIGLSQLTEVPDVVGMSEQDAREVLDDAGFKVDIAGPAAKDDTGIGTVTAQSPEAGTRAFRGTTVSLTLAFGSADTGSGTGGPGDTSWGELPPPSGSPASSGSSGVPGGAADTRPLTPSVQNLAEADAIAALQAAGYRPVIEGYGPTTAGVATGRVFYQNPPPGTRLARGGVINLWVSSGGPLDGGYDGFPYPRPGY